MDYPSLEAAKLLRILKGLGYEIVRQRGSHRVLRRPGALVPATASDTRVVVVIVHQEDDTWWAESPTVLGLYAAADTRDELMVLVFKSIEFAADDIEDQGLRRAIQEKRFAVVAADAGSEHLALGM